MEHKHPQCPPPYHTPIAPEVSRRDIAKLWAKIEERFADRQDVLNLASELQRIDLGQQISTSQVAEAAASIVIKSVQSDLESLKLDVKGTLKNIESFEIRVVAHTDKDGYPVVENPASNVLYLAPADQATPDAAWDEWIALPVQRIGAAPGTPRFRWERVGQKKIDLSWVKNGFDDVNKAIVEIHRRISKYTKGIADTMLDKAIRPLKDLREYVNSPEYIELIFQRLPRAGMGTDGLMTANHFAILSMLAVWASNDQKVMGGGAVGPDAVIHLFKCLPDELEVPVDDLQEYFKHGCGVCEWDEFEKL